MVIGLMKCLRVCCHGIMQEYFSNKMESVPVINAWEGEQKRCSLELLNQDENLWHVNVLCVFYF